MFNKIFLIVLITFGTNVVYVCVCVCVCVKHSAEFCLDRDNYNH